MSDGDACIVTFIITAMLAGACLVNLAVSGCQSSRQNAPVGPEPTNIQAVVAAEVRASASQIAAAIVNAQRTQKIESGRDTNVQTNGTAKWMVGALVAIVALLVPSPASGALKWYRQKRSRTS